MPTVVTFGGHTQHKELLLTEVYYVPGLSVTLLSLWQLVQDDYLIRFDQNGFSGTRGKHRKPLFQAHEHNGVYEVPTPESQFQQSVATAFVARQTRAVPLSELHRKLGHLSVDACRRLASSNAVDGVTLVLGHPPPVCKACAFAKVTKAPAPRKRSSPDELAAGGCHIDVAGPIRASYHGSTFFLVAVWRDYIVVHGMKSKDEAKQKTSDFLHFIERQAEVPVSSLKVVGTDGGTDFFNADFRALVAGQGIRHQRTARYRSSQNGVAERTIRTVTDMAAAMLIDSKLPHYLWEDDIIHAAYIRDRGQDARTSSAKVRSFPRSR
ncbi:hypothetical protein PF004_g30108 [Phytophthora fragariae]|uniref:Integrase catalytic domain-containing protein n=1 Tax=Phytophthora fragariae TaxID=53985 RepID=A0A6G0MDK7_9STRA|nr:hypothetical protein PF004_g30108 [Phytophthora fragariae]